ncbi:MAG: hypothetical protein ACE366_16805 [Bradymonadia bacterium]
MTGDLCASRFLKATKAAQCSCCNGCHFGKRRAALLEPDQCRAAVARHDKRNPPPRRGKKTVERWCAECLAPYRTAKGPEHPTYAFCRKCVSKGRARCKTKLGHGGTPSQQADALRRARLSHQPQLEALIAQREIYRGALASVSPEALKEADDAFAQLEFGEDLEEPNASDTDAA